MADPLDFVAVGANEKGGCPSKTTTKTKLDFARGCKKALKRASSMSSSSHGCENSQQTTSKDMDVTWSAMQCVVVNRRQCCL